mgnify:CR=1 FL=1|tara:strand:+ start:4082 stop:4336 length:255 start_codon:yes stop_codon:yes gene_type:complete
MTWKFPNTISVNDLDRRKLTKYFQYKFPLSNYTRTNYGISSDYTGITITNPDGNRFGITEGFYNDCLEYNKVLDREEIINNVLK